MSCRISSHKPLSKHTHESNLIFERKLTSCRVSTPSNHFIVFVNSTHVTIFALTALQKLAACGKPEVSKEAKGALVRLEVNSHDAADAGKADDNDGRKSISVHLMLICYIVEG